MKTIFFFLKCAVVYKVTLDTDKLASCFKYKPCHDTKCYNSTSTGQSSVFVSYWFILLKKELINFVNLYSYHSNYPLLLSLCCKLAVSVSSACQSNSIHHCDSVAYFTTNLLLLCCTCGPRRMCALKTHWLNTNGRPCLHKLHMCLLVFIRAAIKLPSATWVVCMVRTTTCSGYCFTDSQKMYKNSMSYGYIHNLIPKPLYWNKTKPLYTAYSMHDNAHNISHVTWWLTTTAEAWYVTPLNLWVPFYDSTHQEVTMV